MINSKVILITGTRKGIGHHLALHYSAQGHQVVGCSRKPLDDDDLEEASYRHFELDICNEAAVKAMFAGIRKEFGRLDVLINNAGIASMNHFLLTPTSTLEMILDTNVVGTFLMCREAAKLMKTLRLKEAKGRGDSGNNVTGGRIVNFTTIAVPLKLGGEAAYVASKSAVIGLTEVLARELSDFGITVNAIGPTPVKTDFVRNVPEEKLEAILKLQAIKRFGEFHDVINAIDFFINPESDFITGQTLFLGGV